MFSHLKDLLRQRKERRKTVQKKETTTARTVPTIIVEKSQQSDNNTLVSRKNSGSKRASNTSLANQLVKESNKRMSQLPTYPGLERFELIKKIGDGAFSNVFEAYDLETGKKVALKVAQKTINKDKDYQHLHSSLIKKPRVTERANIIKEVQIMRAIKHPNIVQLIQYTETKENYFLALELCLGGELFHQIVKLTYFSEPLARHVIVQVAQAVRYLHQELGVVHRDIKPENILFDPIPIIPSKKRTYRPTDNRETKQDEGEFIEGVGGGGIGCIKLADFGLSKVIWNNSTFTPCGTVGYTAPEIVRDKTYSKSVDTWAIGCVLYTILCGFPPFYDESIPELTAKVARGQYTFLSPWWDTISDSVKDLISHLLCVDVQKRYTIEQLFEHPWIRQEPFIRSDVTKAATSLRQVALQNQRKKAIDSIKQKQGLVLPETNNNKVVVDDELLTCTPDAATLRGIFDVTYAVQRMEEEEHPTEEAQQHDAHCQIPETQKRHNLPIAQELAKKNMGVANPKSFPLQQQKQNTSLLPTQPKQFRLDLNNATLLNNRKNVKLGV